MTGAEAGESSDEALPDESDAVMRSHSDVELAEVLRCEGTKQVYSFYQL